MAAPLIAGRPRGYEWYLDRLQVASVDAPQAAMHLVPAQTKGGVAPATGLGTHGTPLQQLALDAHAPPAFTHCAGEHRGTPTLSW